MTESTPYQPYQPYDASQASAATPDPLRANGPWRVAIEYANKNGQAKPPTIIQIGRTSHEDRGQALVAALRASQEFEPPDPWSPQGRTIFRDGPDGFLVVIEGATSTFHMSVRIVAEVGGP